MLIAEKDGKFFQSCVIKRSGLAIKHVVPKTEEAYNCLIREHEILKTLDQDCFIRLAWAEVKDDSYTIATEWVDGVRLHEAKNIDYERIKEGCGNILFELKEKGIRHRDIWDKNIILRDGNPVLIDFGWAIFDGDPAIYDSELPHANDDLAVKRLLNGFRHLRQPQSIYKELVAQK